MCGIDVSSRTASHKGSGRPRKLQDEMDVQKVVTINKESMVNPFKPTWEDKEPASLLKSVTGVVMPPEETDQLTFIHQADGGGQSEAICVKRLERNADGFWDKITKASVMTFASLFKKVKTRGAEEKEVTINADRSLSGCSLVVASHRLEGSSKL